jgi:4-hydroxy-4-methyl-2-oxoglutarate aldolase
VIAAGDLVMGDRDGVVVVPQAELAAVTSRLEQVAAKEAELHERIAAGDILSLLQRQPGLKDQITYVD